MFDILPRSKTLKQSALEQLREAIMLGVFNPGERLIERILCEKFSVSRTVIRECIRHLESERLITTIPNSGPTVTILDAEQVTEIYDIRGFLESTAAYACAQLANDRIVQQLNKHCEIIEARLRQNDLRNTLKQTRLFYQTIFFNGGKSVSWDLVEQSNSRISQLRRLTLQSEGRSRTGPANLRKITTAIQNRDPQAAANACQMHAKEALAIALKCLRDRED